MANLTIPGRKAARGRVYAAYLEGGSQVDGIRRSQLEAAAQAAGSNPNLELIGTRLTPHGGVVYVRSRVNPIPLSTVLYLALGGLGVFTLIKVGEGVEQGVASWFRSPWSSDKDDTAANRTPADAANQGASWWDALKAGVPPLYIASQLWHRYLAGDDPPVEETATAGDQAKAGGGAGASGSW